MSNELLGDELYLHWDNAGSNVGNYTTPTWQNQTSVGDVGFDSGNEQVEIPLRIAFKAYKKGRADWSLTFNANYNKGGAFLQAVRGAITNGTRIHLGLSDGSNTAANTTSYWHAWWFLSGPLDGSLDNPAGYDVEGKIHHNRGTNDDEVPAFVPNTA